MTYLAILLFSTVVWLAKGHYDPSVPLLVLVFLAWSYLTVFKPSSSVVKKGESYFYCYFPWLSAVMMAIKPNLIYVLDGLRPAYQFYRFIPLTLTAISLRKTKIIGWSVAFAFLIFFFTALYLSPNPHIDVFVSNTSAVDFFLQGLNPYSQTYVDIYGGRFDYHPGFVYWPMALYLQTVSKLIFGDIRSILVLAWWCAAFFFPKNNPRAAQLKKIWWLIPFLAFGFEQGWIDPLLSLMAAITLWSMKNKKWWLTAIAIGLAASIKQYGFIIGAFPLIALALDQGWKVVGKVSLFAGILFIALLAPFLIWNLQDFISMTLTTHAHALARPDALNFTAFWMKISGTDFPWLAQLAMTLLGFALAFFHVFRNRANRGLAVIPESWAIAFGFSTLFGKFAFCNYHWLLISFWLLSLAFEDDGRALS